MGRLEDDDRPEQREAPDVLAIVEVGDRAGGGVEGPVEAREAWRHVVEGGGVGDAGAGWEVSGGVREVWVEGACLTLMLTDGEGEAPNGADGRGGYSCGIVMFGGFLRGWGIYM